MKKILLLLLLFILVLVPVNPLFSSGLTLADVKSTTTDIALHISPSGNDANDGTAEHPLKTITAAVYQLPQVINHNVLLLVDPGVYNEDVSILGFTGRGIIQLLGANSLSEAANFTVNKIHYRYNTVRIVIRGFTATTTTDTAFLAGYNPGYTEINYSRVVTAASFRGFGNYYSPYTLFNECEVSNREVGIYTAGGKTWSVNQTGVNNVVGLYAEKLGQIGKNGLQPNGTTPEGYASGGSIVPAN